MSTGRVADGEVFRRGARGPGALVQLLALTAHATGQRARGALIWGLALGAYGAVMVFAFPSLAGDPAMEQMVESMPRTMRDLMGFGESTGFDTVESFLATEMLNFIVPLALSVFPILLLSSALAGAEEDGTMDVLLSNPLPRWQLVASRFLAAAVLLALILAVMGGLTWATALASDVELDAAPVAAAALSLWPLCLFFGGVAMVLSALLHRRFLALAVPVALLVLMYFVDGLAGSVEVFERVRPLSAFYYYGSAIQDGVDWASFAGLTGVTLLLVGLAMLLFRRRDIYT